MKRSEKFLKLLLMHAHVLNINKHVLAKRQENGFNNKMAFYFKTLHLYTENKMK